MDKCRPLSALRLLVILLSVSLLYRGYILFETYSTSSTPLMVRLAPLSLGLLSDIGTVVIICAVLQILSLLAGARSNGLVNICIWVSTLSIVSIYLINTKLFSTLYIGLNYTMLYAYLHQGTSTLNLAAFISFHDVLFYIAAIIITIVTFNLSQQTLKHVIYFGIAPIYYLVIMFSATIFASHIYINNRWMTLFNNPIAAIASSYLQSRHQFNDVHLTLDQAQLHSVKLIDPDFLQTQTPMPASHSSGGKNWNVVIFILESVGANYIFSEQNGHSIPMPFLKKLSQQGLWFNHHYTGGNNSPLGEFSILTGLYPNPTPVHFEMQENINIASLADWLGKKYDSFLVSASNNLYCSMALNKSFSQYMNAETIHPDGKQLFFDMFLDENESFHYFQQRLIKTSTPFLAVYWSGAAHYPYRDYSKQFVLRADTKQAYSRYINSLNMLDHEIKSTFELLKNKKMLDHTIFIVVGDHGESFGQHGFWVHGQSLYQEEIQVPLLIYAPKLFKGRQVKQLTSSIDILPTILDAMNISVHNKLQGESIFSKSQTRKYIFIYGDQDEIAAIDQHQMKTKLSFTNNTCVRFDLNKNTNEQFPLPCTTQDKAAILKFRHYQPSILTNIGKRFLD